MKQVNKNKENTPSHLDATHPHVHTPHTLTHKHMNSCILIPEI